jgi:hypothetical protein
VWRDLRDELHSDGFELVTVALDVDADAARPFIEAAAPTHPSLIDEAHVLDELFGVVNVPNGVWIDEVGMIVRPAEPAFPGRNPALEMFENLDPDTLPPEIGDVVREAKKIKTDPEAYKAALVDWVANGEASRYALPPDEVVARSPARDISVAEAAARFELGQHLHRHGDHAAAIPHWQAAHHLQPDNWTYRRQAWNFEDPIRQGHTDAYDSSWFEDVKKIGAENYYPPYDFS